MKKTIVVGLILIGTASVTFADRLFVHAQGAGISISPLNFELTANPGDSVANKIKVTNPSNVTLRVQMTVEDFAVAGETGQVIVEPAETETYSLAKWVTVVPESFTLAPGERRVVDFIIKVPQNAEPGGHYGSILATLSGSAGDSGFAGVGVSQKVGSLVLLSVSGDATESLAIVEFIVPDFLEFGPVPFVLRFENTGSVHVRPRGLIAITNWRDKKVADVEFPQKNVLPGSKRKVETSWDVKWLFGKYTATVVGSYGTSNTPLSPWVVSFWVFPWKIGSVVGGTAFLVLLFFFLTRRRWTTALGILLKGDKRRR